MSLIPESTIQEIRSRADIVAFISRYVDLRQAGRSWKGLCPFHEEKTASFNVNPDRDIFHCFGCQAGGDVIGFLMKHDGLTFPEATRILAAELGIVIPEEQGGEERAISERIFEANEIAQALYRESLGAPEAKAARAYLASRGLADEDADRFGIGFAPARWDAVAERLRSVRIPGEIGAKAGLLAERNSSPGYYDRLRGRITFPIQDLRGRVIGFGGRALEPDQEPKYLNTPESPVFHKRQTLYGHPDALEAIRRAQRIILCEGYFDRIAFARAGLGEALATCGTALTPEHGAQLRRRAREIVLVFDGDEAGRKATEKALAILLPSGLRIRAAFISGGADPDDLLKEEGPEALRRLVDEAPDALELAIRDAVRHGVATPDQKADAVARVAPLVARVVDAVSRDEYTRRLALAVGASPAAVMTLIRDAVRSPDLTLRVEVDSLGLGRSRRDAPEDRQLRALARLCLLRPDLLSDESALRMHEVLPAGSWKSIINEVVEAAAEGLGGAGDDPGIDPFAIEGRLDEDARLRLREIAVDDSPIDSETPAAQVLEDLIGWFDARRLSARTQDLSRRLRDRPEDHESLLAQKQALLLERRARLGIGTDGGRHVGAKGPGS